MGSFASPIAAAFARQRNSTSSLALTSSSGNAQPADDSLMEQEATPGHEGLESQAPRYEFLTDGAATCGTDYAEKHLTSIVVWDVQVSEFRLNSGKVHRGFQSGILDENLQENVDETHFVINMDNGRTLGFRGDRNIKYADVVSGGVSMTMVVKVTGGRSAKICSPLMIFQNDNCSYPIRGVPDNIPGVSYRTTRKSFMTNACLLEYYNEKRASWADPSGGTKIQWLDNVSSHNMMPETEEALKNIRTEVPYLPTNSTHLTQPCDTFVISKIKDAWTKLWEEHKVNLILHNEWQGDGDPGTSGLLKNPGKTFFLNLVAKAVAEVNQQKTKAIGLPGEEGYVPPMTFARKAMIMCGLSLNTDGRWTESQLCVGLQNIIS
ncbi:hypothetical protein R1sor_005430 [Riccia sorocarpa]|uniref:DDE-1 domain-containing protein n=1 Tax=Riccia sorocarpa TaxID=122646 RepID=A0ABD3HN40_9MARC